MLKKTLCIILLFVFSINVYSFNLKTVSKVNATPKENIEISVGTNSVQNNLKLITANIEETALQLKTKKAIINALAIDRKTETIECSYIANMHGKNQFLLIEGENSYFIYDLSLEKIIEYSTVSKSNWGNIEGQKIYNGPTKYYVYSNNNIIDTMSQTRTPAEITFGFSQDTFSTNVDVVKNSLYEESLNAYNQTQINEENLATTSTTAPPNTSLGLMFAGSYLIEEEHVPFSYFFKNAELVDNYNREGLGSCGYVALSLLLAYYDTFYNDNIVPDTIEEIKEEHDIYESTGLQTASYKINDDANADSNTDSCVVDPKVTHLVPTIEFHDFLVFEYDGDPNNPKGTFAWGLIRTINNFLSNYSTFTTSVDVEGDWGYFGSRSQRIREGKPIIMGVKSYEYYQGTNTSPTPGRGWHYLVVYGFRRTANQTFYHAHLGYSGQPDVWIDSGNFGDFVYINYDEDEPIVPSNNYKNEHKRPDGSTHTVYLNPRLPYTNYFTYYDTVGSVHRFKCVDSSCNAIIESNITTHMYNTYTTSTEPDKHVKKCDYCNDDDDDDDDDAKIIEEHEESIAVSISSTQHKILCDCGVIMKTETHELDTLSATEEHCIRSGCSVCGEYVSYREHSFNEYENGTSSTHKNFCSLCGIENTSHDIVSVETGATTHNATCSCGYVITNEAHVIGTTPRRHYCEICDYSGEHTLSSYSGITVLTHSRTCSTCNEVIVAEHLFIYMYDSSGHYQACACGYSTTVENHVYSNYVNNGLNHIATCVCGHQRTELHLWTNNIFGGQICHICGATTGMLHPFKL